MATNILQLGLLKNKKPKILKRVHTFVAIQQISPLDPFESITGSSFYFAILLHSIFPSRNCM